MEHPFSYTLRTFQNFSQGACQNHLEDYSSVYERVNKDFGIDLYSMSSVETNEIIFPDESELLNALNLSFREPVVKQVKHTYLVDKSVAEYIVSYKH